MKSILVGNKNLGDIDHPSLLIILFSIILMVNYLYKEKASYQNLAMTD